MSRSSHWRCSIKTDVLKNHEIFIGKQLCWSLFLIKLFQDRCFPVNIAKSLRAPISKRSTIQMDKLNKGQPNSVGFQ